MRFIGSYKGFKLSANYGGWAVVGQLEKGGCIIIGEIHDTDAANLLVSMLNEKVRGRSKRLLLISWPQPNLGQYGAPAFRRGLFASAVSLCS